jgi:hypothetical protein
MWMIIVMGMRRTQVICEGVSWEDIGLRERVEGELVHVRTSPEADKDSPCDVCGLTGGVWLEKKTSHNIHRDRCGKNMET